MDERVIADVAITLSLEGDECLRYLMGDCVAHCFEFYACPKY